MDAESSWIPGVIAGLAGLCAASWSALTATRKAVSSADADAMTLANLDERFEHLTAQLRDLEDHSKRLTPEGYREQRSAFERMAADVLRERDAVIAGAKKRTETESTTKEKTMPEPKPSSQGFWHRHQKLEGALWGGGMVAMAAFLYISVNADQTLRPQGGSMTGNSGGQVAGPSAAAGGTAPRIEDIDPAIRPLIEKLHQNPDDIPTLVQLSKMFLKQQQIEPVEMLVTRILALEPANLDGLTYQAMLKAAKGDTKGALDGLNDVIKRDEKFPQAYFFRGMLSMRSGDSETMKASWEKFVEVAPDGPQKERIKGFLKGEGLQMPGRQP